MHRQPTTPRTVAATTATASRVATLAAGAGPGWFDSSWDLSRGLDVVEERHPDVALRAWLDAFLDAVPAQPRASRVASPSSITAIA